MVLVVVLTTVASAAGQGSVEPIRLPTAGTSEEGADVIADGPSHLLFVEIEVGEPTNLVRVDIDGSLDPTFGTGGKVAIDARGLAVQPDGKILVATTSAPEGSKRYDARVTRLLADGEPDLAFGTEGHVDVHFGRMRDFGEAVAVEPDGDILLAGTREDYTGEYGFEDTLAVARLKPDGRLDRSFGKRGVRILPYAGEDSVFGVVAMRSGRIAIAGGNDVEGVILGLKYDGRLDRHFGYRGWFEFPRGRKAGGEAEGMFFAPQLTQTANGSLLLAATGDLPDGGSRAAALRLRPDGRRDRSFGHQGWALGPLMGRASTEAAGVTLLPGGVLAVATAFVPASSDASDFGVTLFGRHGRLDRSFGNGGVCRARLPERQEAIGIATVGGRAEVLGEDYEDQWLLACGE